ncbi:MAG: hypothetical protein J7641_19685 [Cyanobacteria bacterium SID2]|nr:hypothetical protein [Cyanobacteria bacterium SID2]MBP0004243.1 hypothetical protein [Cyanobacteria bacterium SBC]
MRQLVKIVIYSIVASVLLLISASPALAQGVCDPTPQPSDGCGETPLATYAGSIDNTSTTVTIYASGWVEIRLDETLQAGYRDDGGQVAVGNNLTYQLSETDKGLQIQQFRNGNPTTFRGQLGQQ